MTFHVKTGGTWRTITDPRIKLSGTWTQIKEGWVKVSGTWQKFYQRLTATLTNQTVSDSAAGSYSYASYTINSAGSVDGYLFNGGGSYFIETWGTGGAAYDVRATVVSGSVGGSATGTWLSCSTSRSWDVTAGSAGTVAAQLTVEIRDASTLSVLATATINLDATWL